MLRLPCSIPPRLPRCAAAVAPAVLAMALGSGMTAIARAATHPLLEGCPDPLTPDCAERLEHRALQTHADLARRESGVLSLGPSLQAGTPPPPGARWLGPLGDSGLQLLVEFPSGQPPTYRLAGDGAPPSTLPGPAWPAPGDRLLISAGTLAGGQPEVVLLGRVESRWRVLLRQEAPPGGQLSVVGWRGDAAAARLLWTCHGAPALALQLRDGPYGWDWVPALPTRCGR